MRSIVLAILAAGCAPAGYYVSNVYVMNDQVLVEKCEISGGNRKPNPSACHVEVATSPPAEVAAALAKQKALASR